MLCCTTCGIMLLLMRDHSGRDNEIRAPDHPKASSKFHSGGFSNGRTGKACE